MGKQTLSAVPKIKRLIVDIEVSPNVVLAWRAGFDLVITPESIIQERKIICIGYKWHGSNKTHVLRWDSNQDDRKMLIEFIPIANSADEIIWHYGDKFDGKFIRGRCLINKLPPIPEWKTVDTKKLASGYYNLNCNKLDYLAQLLGLGDKLPTGYQLWKDVLLGKSKKALDKMCLYCAHDVDILELVYDQLVANAKPKTHVGVLAGKNKWTCPRTGSENVVKAKTRVTASGTVQHQMQSLADGSYFQISDTAYRAYLAAKKKPTK